jgi:hypothetical protein
MPAGFLNHVARLLRHIIDTPVWYICAMAFSRLALFAILLAMSQAYMPVSGQTATHIGNNPQSAPRSTAATQGAGSPAGSADCNGVPCDEQQQPHVIVTLPPPAPQSETLRDRILWGANLALVLLGYVGIMMALSTLRKIERQTRAAEASATAALESAHAALLSAQSNIDSERPWLLISVEPSLNIDNSFNVMATNRGRTPAKIIATLEQIKIAIDETRLPGTPEYRNEKPGTPFVPNILLPGESMAIMPFRRDDLKGVCESEETFKKVVNWEEKVFIYGKVIYRDLIASPDNQVHETAWCCWYIHGRQRSGLVTAGPPPYNSHT